MNINCPHFGRCSGCQLDNDVRNIGLKSQAEAYFSSKGIKDFILHAGNPIHWRFRAKLAVQGDASDPIIGLYEEGSHRVLDIPHCKVHHPAINAAVEHVKTWIKSCEIVPYDESSRKGLLRYIQLVVERQTGKIQLTLVLNLRQDAWDAADSIRKSLDMLWKAHDGIWHSIWLNFNPGKDNVIFSPRWQIYLGEKWLKEKICNQLISFHPASFAQANLEMFETMLNEIKTLIGQRKGLLEYYAGVGAIGLALGDNFTSVKCVEIAPQAKGSFEDSLLLLPLETRKKFSFIEAPSEEALSLLDEKPGVVIVDPPRKGLSQTMLEALANNAGNFTLIYISCGWDSFKRDCDHLIKAGWRLQHASGYLFFPGTNQLETLSFFTNCVI